MALNQLSLALLVLVAMNTVQSAAPVLKPDPPHAVAGKWDRARHSYRLADGIGYYRVYEDNLNWGDAWLACLKDGSHLATIESKAEEDVIFALLQAYPNVTYIASVGFHSLFVQNQYTTLEGTLLETQNYVHWNTDQPNDSSGRLRCGGFDKGEGGLFVTDCSIERSFICEHDV